MASYEKPNKNWAKEYILDPLNAPTPAEETGLGASFRPTNTTTTSPPSKSKPRSSSVQERKTSGSLSSSTNPFRRKSPGSSPNGKASPTTHTREISNGNGTDNGRQQFPEFDDGISRSRGSSLSKANGTDSKANRSRRSSSLRERYPGDTSIHPLETITKDIKTAHRSPHLRKKHHHGSDSIDKLDDASLASYHHESPYDAASLARNNSYTHAPLAALAESNKETLKATPREKIIDSVEGHRPLDGVAYFPPGQADPMGRVLNYKEGSNMMTEHGGDYKRWPGVDYLPEDIKGKGEPSYTIEKKLKEHEANLRAHPIAPNGDYELVERPRKSSGRVTVTGAEPLLEDHQSAEGNRSRSGSGNGHRLRKRIGSLRKKDREASGSAQVNGGADY